MSFGVHMPLIIIPMLHTPYACSEKESAVVVLLFSLFTHSAIRNWEQRTELYGVNDKKHSFYMAAGTLLTPVQAIY